MAHVTFVARSMDGLILVETWDGSNKVSPSLKNQAKQLLGKMQNMPPKCSVDCAGNQVFHYSTESGVVYMALYDHSYPKNLAFAFLDDIHKLFQEELKREFGTGSVDYRSHIETIEKPYYFIKFDRQITKKKMEYRDPNSSKALQKLNDSLNDVQSIMRQNMNEILERGENLDSVSGKASKLREGSSDFSKMTRRLSFQTLVQKYGVPVVLGFVVFLIVCFKLWKR